MAKTLISTYDIAVLGASESIDITDGIDDTYNEYEFHFVGIHAETLHKDFQFQVNASDDEGGDFDTSLITSNFFRTYMGEAGDYGGPTYKTDRDQAVTAGYQDLSYMIDQDDGDECLAGMLTLYDPASTTYLKHFQSRTNANHHNGEYTLECFVAGYIGTDDPADQPAITEIRFRFDSGDIEAGVIKMFGVS